MPVAVQPSGRDVGAQISGLDLARPVSPQDLQRIERAFIDHQVLLFRGPILTAQQFAKFSAHFGPLRQHIQKAFQHPEIPEIVYNRNVDEDGNFDEAGAKRGVAEDLHGGWHADTNYEKCPAKATAVHALEIPSSGGNTCFASGYRAYDSLPSDLKERINGLQAEFALGRNRRNPQTQTLTQKLTAEDKSAQMVIHPLICRNPDSGRRAIFANPLLTVRVLGVAEHESDTILDTLFDHIHTAGTTGAHWEHEWQVGDTLMWENRGGLFHSGRLDYPLNQRRIMIRTTIGASAIEAAV